MNIHLDGNTNAPDIVPPRAPRLGAKVRSLFPNGGIPRILCRAVKLSMSFPAVAMVPQFFQDRIGMDYIADSFRRKQGGESVLPKLMQPLNFSLRLRRWRIPQRNIVEVQGAPQICKRVRNMGKEEAVIVNVERQWKAVLLERTRQEVHVSIKIFFFIKSCARDITAAIVEHVKERPVCRIAREPPMRGYVQLPERSNPLTLPAPNRSRVFPWPVALHAVRLRPAPHGGPIYTEAKPPQGFGGD